jgi:hypothetical protein
LLIAGDQLPVKLLFELDGKINASPEQIGLICVKVGVTGCVTLTVIDAVFAHWPASGVNV